MAGKRTFVAGEVLTASNINSFLMDQVVAVFDDSSARDSGIPTPEEGNVVYLKSDDQVSFYDGVAWRPISGGFTASTAITSTNASWPVPSLASSVVKVTVVGGGGGGGGVIDNPGTGGTTTFNAGSAGTVTALGGVRGTSTPDASLGNTSQPGVTGRSGLTAGNGGTGGMRTIATEDKNFGGSTGGGGEVTVAYLDLDGISTVNVTIGAGGAGSSGGSPTGGSGGSGEVIVEYVAA